MIKHLAVIMDGNRRWAKLHNKPTWQGHREGAKKIETVLQFCLDYSIVHVSLYAFSLENFNRSALEKKALFSLLVSYAYKKASELKEKNIRVRMLGDLEQFPEDVQKACLYVEQETQDCTRLQCNFLIAYGGQQEIERAATLWCQQKQDTKQPLSNFLWTAGQPNPDIIIRTGNVQRLSNFLLYQAAYAEIRFLQILWPDITQEILYKTVKSCLEVNKNFGV